MSARSLLLLAAVIAELAYGHSYTTSSTCEDVESHRNLELLPKKTECGPVFPAGYGVMFGRPAREGEFPWMAQLFSLNQGQWLPFCDGSVINKKYIVTAAHCGRVVKSPREVKIRLGTLNRGDKEICHETQSCSSQVEHRVEEIIIHELFDEEIHNDIALLRVLGEINFNELIAPICLPTSCSLMMKNFTGVLLDVMGWGSTEEFPEWKLPKILQTARVRGSSQRECDDLWSKEPELPLNISSSQICTRGLHGESPCHGDSGGPLVYTSRHGKGKSVMVGIVSLGDGCNIVHPSNMPDVYTRVSSFIPWILDHIHQ